MQARNASIVGVLVGTLGVAGYLDAIETLRTLIQKCVTDNLKAKRQHLACFHSDRVCTDSDLFILSTCSLHLCTICTEGQARSHTPS